jgi:hypothetical protein
MSKPKVSQADERKRAYYLADQVSYYVPGCLSKDETDFLEEIKHERGASFSFLYNSKAQHLDEIEAKINACKEKKEQDNMNVSNKRARELNRINDMLTKCHVQSTRFRLEALKQHYASAANWQWKSNEAELNLIDNDIQNVFSKIDSTTGGRKSKKPKRKKITRRRR